MLWVAGWCPTNCCSSGLSDNIWRNSVQQKKAGRVQGSTLLIPEECSADAAQSWCHWRFALQCGDLAITSALEPFSAARVVQSSDCANQNLGQSLCKHMELEERRKYSDFFYLGCGLDEVVSLLADMKCVCQCLADMYAERLEKPGWNGVVQILGLSLLDAT